MPLGIGRPTRVHLRPIDRLRTTGLPVLYNLPSRMPSRHRKLRSLGTSCRSCSCVAPVVLFASPYTVAALAVIPLIWWSRWKARGYLLPRTPLDWPIVVMMVMVPVSLLVTFDIGFSLGKVALLIYGVALYYAVVDWARGRPRLRRIVSLYLSAGGLLAVLGLLGTDWQHKVPGLSDIVSVLPQIAQRLSRDQTGFHPNIVAGALLWVVLPLLALAGTAWSVRRPAHYRGPGTRAGLLLLLLLTGGTFLLTQSRSALVGAVVGGGLLVWLAAPRLRIWLATLTLAAVVIVAIVGPAQLTGSIGDTVGPQFSTLTQTDNLVLRVQVWKSALHAIADYPLTGIGVDTFRRLMPFRYPAAAVPDSYDIGHAHNQLLQAALDLGLPGLVGYLALWIVAAMLAAKSYRQAISPWQRALAAGIAASLLASFLHGLTDAVALVSKPGVMFWGLLGIDTALWLQVRAEVSAQAQIEIDVIEAADNEREPTLRDVAALQRFSGVQRFCPSYAIWQPLW